MRVNTLLVILLSYLGGACRATEFSEERIEFCKEILIAADQDGDGFINYPEYHLHILKQISPYEKCPPVNVFGVQLNASYVDFHAEECIVCEEYDDESQCCNSNPMMAKWSVPGVLYPDSYTKKVCSDLMHMIEQKCDTRPDEEIEMEERQPISGNVEKLRYYLMVLIPLIVLGLILCCLFCVGAWRHREEEETEEKSLDTKKSSSIDKDDHTEDPTETEADLEMNSPRSFARTGNFAGLLSVVEGEYEDDYMNEFQPRSGNDSGKERTDLEGGDDSSSYISSSSDESSVSSASSSESEDSVTYSETSSENNERLSGFLDKESELPRKLA